MEEVGEYKQACRHLRRGGDALQQDTKKLKWLIQQALGYIS
jgi:hypothetical protein